MDCNTCIDLILVIIAVFSAILSVYTVHQSKVQYLEGQKPIISTTLLVNEIYLRLLVINNGKDIATDVTLSDFKIEGNGVHDCSNNEFKDIVFDLYPEERVCRKISIYSGNLKFTPNPIVSFVIIYNHNGNRISQERRVALFLE